MSGKSLKNITSAGIWLLFVACGLLYFSSCKRSVSTRPGWNTSILTPLVTSTLSFNNLVNDTLLKANADSSLQLVYKNSLYSFNPAQQNYKIPDTTLTVGYSINTLGLADQKITYSYSLGQLANQVGNPTKQEILDGETAGKLGFKVPVPAIGVSNTPPQVIDATQFFQSATLEAGSIKISITNGFPLLIDTLVFRIGNSNGTGFNSRDTFLNLLPNKGNIVSKTIPLANQTVEGTLAFQVIRMHSPGGSVLVDTTNAIVTNLQVTGLVVQSATAVFPSQNLIDQDNPTSYSLSGGARLKKIKVKSGMLRLAITSSVDDVTHFSMVLPGALSSNGTVLKDSAVLPPAVMNSRNVHVQTFNLAGYTLDLSAGPGYNTYLSHFIASIDSTGKVATLSTSDSIHISYSLVNIVPEYVQGYLGQQIVTIGPSSQTFNLFNRIKGGSLLLQSASVGLEIDNGIGVDGRLTLYQLSSVNTTTTHKTVLLTSSSFVKTPLFVKGATDNPFTPTSTFFNLNNTNSNITSLIDNLPNSLAYNFDVFINPNGNTHNYTDFAYDTSKLNVSLNLTVPLSLITNQLTFQDTVNFNLGQTNVNGTSAIKDGTFNLIANNGFPLSANMQLYLYDNAGNFIDSLMAAPHLIAAGMLDNNCRVSQKTQSIIQIPVDADKMNKIRGAKRAIIRAAFTTVNKPTCNGGYTKIYSDYTIKVQLTGKFTYYTGE